MDRPLDVGARTRSPEFDDNRSAERWTEKLEAWGERLDDAMTFFVVGPYLLESLAVEIESECGQGDAWAMVCHLAAAERAGIYTGTLRTAARDAILAIPEPTDD